VGPRIWFIKFWSINLWSIKLSSINQGVLRVLSMNKGELVDQIASKIDVTKKDADAILTAMMEVVMEAVSSGDKVTLVGFGTFEARDRQAREGRNPSTGAPIQIPATRVPAFSAGKQFKESVLEKS
jgi:DNA-binding protein HU-beta